MNKELFDTIIAIANQKNIKISQAKQNSYEKLVAKTLDELDLVAEQLFSEDIKVRKKAAVALERKPLMDLMKDEAGIAREWFMDKSNREKIEKAIEQEKDETILSALLSTIGLVCERFSSSTLLSWALALDYLKYGYRILNNYLDNSSDSVRLTAALALTQFRQTEAWNILYEFTKKANSKIYIRISNRLFNYGNNRLKVFDERDNGEDIETLNALGFIYCKDGLTQEQCTEFQTALELAYGQKISSDAKDAIIDALQSIGDDKTVVFLNEKAINEQDEYRKEKIYGAIETLQSWLT